MTRARESAYLRNVEDIRPLFKRAKFVAYVVGITTVAGMFIANRVTHGAVETDETLAFALTALITTFMGGQSLVDFGTRKVAKGLKAPEVTP